MRGLGTAGALAICLLTGPALADRSCHVPEGEFSRWAAYAELGGPMFASVNLDFRPVEWLSLRAGAGPAGVGPFGAVLLGSGGHYMEAGGGFVLRAFLMASDDDASFYAATLGYRYQRPRGGFLLRATATPIWRVNDVEDRLFMASVSLGGSY
jgi:hypothetical protein